MCYLPFGLKRRWHDALRPLVEQWIGNVELEDTDLYGLRRYTRGSTLMPHVDREETHAASVIVNIGQYGMDEAWPLQIYDLHSGEMTNVTMEAGELLFYESAKCLHGREVPQVFLQVKRGNRFVPSPVCSQVCISASARCVLSVAVSAERVLQTSPA